MPNSVTSLPYVIDPTRPDFQVEPSWTAVRAVHKAIEDSTLNDRTRHLCRCMSGVLEDCYSYFDAWDTPEAAISSLSNFEVRLTSGLHGREPTAEESYAIEQNRGYLAEVRRKLDNFKTMLAIALEVHFTLTDDTLLLPGDANTTIKRAPPPTRSLLDERRWRLSTPAEMTYRLWELFLRWPEASASLQMRAQLMPEHFATRAVRDNVTESTPLPSNATGILAINDAIAACGSDLRSLGMDETEESHETLRTDVLNAWTVGDVSSLVQTQLANGTQHRPSSVNGC